MSALFPIPTPIASVCCPAVINQAAPRGPAAVLSRGRVLQPMTTDMEVLAEVLVAKK